MRKKILFALAFTLTGLAAGATRPNGPLVPQNDGDWCIYRDGQEVACGSYGCLLPCWAAYSVCVREHPNDVSGCDEQAAVCGLGC